MNQWIYAYNGDKQEKERINSVDITIHEGELFQ